MLTMQGLGAALAGGVAQLVSPGLTMAIMAAASVTVTLFLAPGLRTPVSAVAITPARDGPGTKAQETRPAMEA
jgi:hypothetical protein